MLTLQHRGEDACGITSIVEETGIHQQKLSLVTKSFQQYNSQNYQGICDWAQSPATIGGDSTETSNQ